MPKNKQQTTIENVARSIDTLAIITKRGFDEVDKRFGKVDKRFGKLEYNLKDYIDEKLGKTKGDIIAVIKGDRERDQKFKTKILEIVQRNKLAREDEIELLSELIR